ncbi:hypothetical protein P9112_008968 [Eukaryota sp. TZLM1-RC]
MNIFFLSKNPKEAANDMCDQHIVKMALESTQLMFTCHHITRDPEDTQWMDKCEIETGRVPYKPSHQKHGSQLWLHESKANYMWLAQHAIGISEEYEKRYQKTLQGKVLIHWLAKNPPPNLPNKSMTIPYLAMPEDCKYIYQHEGIAEEPVENGLNRTVMSYKLYYLLYKTRFARYFYIDVPMWLESTLVYIQNLSNTKYLDLIHDEAMRKTIAKKPPKVPKSATKASVKSKRRSSLDKLEDVSLIKDGEELPIRFRRLTRSMTSK